MASTKDITVTKAALARALGCAKSRISQLIGEGLPCDGAGRLKRHEALTWITENTSGYPGGWAGAMRAGKGSLSERARSLLDGRQLEAASTRRRHARRPDPAEDPRTTAYRELLDHVVQGSEALPGILLSAGVRDMGLIHAATDLFALFLFHLAAPFGDHIHRWISGDDIPAVTPNYADLAKRFQVEYDAAEAEGRANDLVGQLDELMDKAEEAVKR